MLVLSLQNSLILYQAKSSHFNPKNKCQDKYLEKKKNVNKRFSYSLFVGLMIASKGKSNQKIVD